MKTPSIKNFKPALLSFFSINKSLAGSVAKWTASNTIKSFNKNGLNMPLTGVETQTTFASQLNKS